MTTRFEFKPNQCAFDSREAMDLARDQYPEDFDNCLISLIGNTVDGVKWPKRSWPSTPNLGGVPRYQTSDADRTLR